MTHLWIRSESRANERRLGITPDGVRSLRARGFHVTVEASPHRIMPSDAYAAAGAEIAPEGAWTDAPPEAFVFGLKELPETGDPLRHRHIMFGHAYKGQAAGRVLLDRFRQGGGRLYDLEYLTGPDGRRLAAFGYWAGFAGAAVTIMAWSAQIRGGICGPVSVATSQQAMTENLRAELAEAGRPLPRAIVIGAKGRVGRGASDLMARLGIRVTAWDMPETARGAPFPEILAHELFINCILAQPGAPAFVARADLARPRALRVIGDVACDPTSDFNPIPLYDRPTDWQRPVLRLSGEPPLDIMAIDNLPSLLPLESSLDFADQLLPVLQALDRPDEDAWGRAGHLFDSHLAKL
ncbi:saccharopine dehydrogenase [Paracoccus ravus]|uniref:saccharopine dehydrogenase n=1 Tax=Paracoccus ravus TaxID=2447760 RepID=UPI00106EB741|nr:saccharopine dehydrogenase [Paracoccus ravus]